MLDYTKMKPSLANVREGGNATFTCLSIYLVTWYRKGSDEFISYGNSLELLNVSKNNVDYECKSKDSHGYAFWAIGQLRVIGTENCCSFCYLIL